MAYKQKKTSLKKIKINSTVSEIVELTQPIIVETKREHKKNTNILLKDRAKNEKSINYQIWNV